MSENRERKRKEALEQIHRQEELRSGEAFRMPAVHPRYRAAYESIYQEDEERPHSTFFICLMVSILLFAGFLNLDEETLPKTIPRRTEIIHEIQAPFDIPASLKQFDLSHIL